MKNKKKCQESKCKHKVAFFTVNSPHRPKIQQAQNFRYRENIGEHTLSKTAMIETEWILSNMVYTI